MRHQENGLNARKIAFCSFPSSERIIYGTTIVIAACITMECQYWIHYSNRQLYRCFWYTIATVFVFSLIRNVGTLLLEQASPEFASSLESHFGQLVRDVIFKIGNQHDFYVRTMFGKRICVVPRRALAVLLAAPPSKKGVQDEFITLIAHELGHLLSGDSRAFQLVEFSIACSVIAVIYQWIVVWYFWFPKIHGGWPLLLRGSLVTVVAIVLFLHFFYKALRAREFSADSLAIFMVGETPVLSFLKRMTKRESHIRFPIVYRLTHPSFSLRLDVQLDYYRVFDYTLWRVFVLSVLTAFLYTSAGMASLPIMDIIYYNTATSNLSSPAVALSAACIQLLAFIGFMLVSNAAMAACVIPAAITGRLRITRLIAWSIIYHALYLGSFLFIYLLITGMSVANLTHAFFGSDSTVSFVAVFAGIVLLYILELSFQVGAFWVGHYLICWRGPKYLSSTIFLLLVVALTAWSFVTTLAVIEFGEIGFKSEMFVAAIILFLPVYFLTRKVAKREGHNIRSRGQFVPAEWPLWQIKDAHSKARDNLALFVGQPTIYSIGLSITMGDPISGTLVGTLFGLITAAFISIKSKS
jgi:hypothetical protein